MTARPNPATLFLLSAQRAYSPNRTVGAFYFVRLESNDKYKKSTFKTRGEATTTEG